jgi:Arc/MetJ-type ribon-helix-helix transcriptional regulator
MGSENGEEMGIITLRLEDGVIDDIDRLVEISEDYQSRSDFIRQAIEKYDYVEPDYELLLDTAYRTKEEWETSDSEYSDSMMYSLGEHIGKLEILNEIDSL